MDRQRAVPLFEESGCGRPCEPHSPETLITLGTLRIHRIWIQKGGWGDDEISNLLHHFMFVSVFGVTCASEIKQTENPKKRKAQLCFLIKVKRYQGALGAASPC